jgi:septal ring factor EnvC (AmiA/AmiB activator)
LAAVKARGLPAWLLAAALLLPLPLRAAPDLEELRGAIDDSRERVGEHEAQERALLDQLEEVDTRLDALSRELSRAEQEAAASRSELEAVEEATRDLARRLEKTRRSLAARAVALYKQGEIGTVRVLFSSDSLAEMISRWGSLRTLVRTDAELALRFREQHARHAAQLQEVAVAAEKSEAAAAELARRSAAVAAERAHKRRLVSRVHEDRVLERALLVELERAARTLEETLQAFGEDAPAATAEEAFDSDFAARQGQLPRPVQAPLSGRFGRVVDAQFQTETFRRGAEFAASPGDSVRAVAAGVVRFQGWFRGYGKIVVIDHGSDYFSVSGHLSSIYVKRGARVDAGDTIGAVGDTGSLAGPGLYFELRRGGEPLDPELWLGPARENAGKSPLPGEPFLG